MAYWKTGYLKIMHAKKNLRGMNMLHSLLKVDNDFHKDLDAQQNVTSASYKKPKLQIVRTLVPTPEKMGIKGIQSDLIEI